MAPARLVLPALALLLWAVPALGQQFNAAGNKAMEFGTCLARDAQGQLWVGTENHGAYRYDTKQRWQQYCEDSDELPEDTVYALACDRKGRMWVGHRASGVSVFNGKAWQNYDALSGPLGQRVFAIAVSPLDGDVWIATDAGLTRYSESKDTWTHITRLQGLPADQASALAFDPKGRLFIGLQADGLVFADPADNYAKFTQVTGPVTMPTAATGKGLPSAMINCLLVSSATTVYAGTPWGLARSDDRGASWTYVRGKDLTEKVKQLVEVERAALTPPPASQLPLAEDYVTTLAEDEDKHLWVGYRTLGYEVFTDNYKSLRADATERAPAGTFVRAILPDTKGEAWIASYAGFTFHTSGDKIYDSARPPEPPAAPLPTAAAAPTPQELAAATVTIKALRDDPGTPLGFFLREDWVTQGDWIGRYGANQAMSCAVNTFVRDTGYRAGASLGPNHGNDWGVCYYVRWPKTTDPRALWDPLAGTRHQGEWNDSSFAYQPEYPGPDLWITFQVPAGAHRVSFYCINKDGRWKKNRNRDFLLELKALLPAATSPAPEAAASSRPIRPHLLEAKSLTTVAQTRVNDFWFGVYKTFLVSGPRTYQLKMLRNGSHCVIVSGIFFDRATGPAAPADPAEEPPSPVRQKQVPGLEGVKYARPELPAPAASDPPAVQAARQLWSALDDACAQLSSAPYQRYYRTLAYRAAAASKADPALLTNWRWQMGFWTDPDRREFSKTMRQAWDLYAPSHHLQTDETHGPGGTPGGQ